MNWRNNRGFDQLQCGRWRWLVCRPAVTDQVRRVLEDPEAFLAQAERLKHDRTTTVGRADGLVLKRFNLKSPLHLVKDSLRVSRACRAGHKAWLLDRAGIRTARVVAVADCRVFGVLRRSYLLMEEIPGAVRLRDGRHDHPGTINRLARTVARLHQTGFHHRDLKESNILLDARGEPVLIDLDGLRYVGTVTDRRAARDLSRLAKAAMVLPEISKADRARFLKQYLAERGRSGWRRWWRHIEQIAHQRWPGLMGQGSTAAGTGRTRWAALPGPAGGWVRRDWQEAFQQAGLRATDDFLAVQGETLAKAGLGRRYRARLTVRRGRELETVYLKRYEGERLGARLRRWYEDGTWRSPAEREVRAAAALVEAGIAGPVTLAWGRRGPCSFVVASSVPGEAVDRWLETRPFEPGPRGWQQKCQLARQLAVLARRFHQAGWRHRDFYLCHIFAEPAAGGYRLALIDLQRVFQPRWRRERWRIKDLAQLNYSVPATGISRTLKLRFAKEYLQTARLTPAQKRLLRRVLRKSQRIRA